MDQQSSINLTEIYASPPGEPWSIEIMNHTETLTDNESIFFFFKTLLDLAIYGMRVFKYTEDNPQGIGSVDLRNFREDELEFLNVYLAMFGAKLNVVRDEKPSGYHAGSAMRIVSGGDINVFNKLLEDNKLEELADHVMKCVKNTNPRVSEIHVRDNPIQTNSAGYPENPNDINRIHDLKLHDINFIIHYKNDDNQTNCSNIFKLSFSIIPIPV